MNSHRFMKMKSIRAESVQDGEKCVTLHQGHTLTGGGFHVAALLAVWIVTFVICCALAAQVISVHLVTHHE